MAIPRNTPHNFRRRIAALVLLPLMAWSVAPAMAGTLEFCAPAEMAELAAHACCTGHETEAEDSPEARIAPDCGEDRPAVRTPPGLYDMRASDPAIGRAPAGGCACVPAEDFPKTPADSSALTVEPPTTRSPGLTSGTAAWLPVDSANRLPTRILKCPDEARRHAATPPLFLLHDLHLI